MNMLLRGRSDLLGLLLKSRVQYLGPQYIQGTLVFRKDQYLFMVSLARVDVVASGSKVGVRSRRIEAVGW